jgi:asparagine synthase (glutamine-hydrolysing)
MDSSALVALMNRITQPKTFSVVFDEPSFNEAPFSRAVAERFNSDHSEIRLTEDRLIALLPQAIAAIDQPTMDGINTYVVSGVVKHAGITVALSGLGGDELFGGYPSFRRALRFAGMSQAQKHVLRAISRFAPNGSVQRQKFAQLMNSDGRPEDIYQISRQLFSGAQIARIKSADPGVTSTNGHYPDPDVVNAISRLEMKGYMTNTLLRDTDAMSMAHSLEVRVPFVDMNVVNYVLSLPGEWKVRPGGGSKPLLVDAMADLLPPEFMRRPKMGFTLPFEKWLQHDLRNEVASVLEDADRIAQTGLNAEEVSEVWRRFLRKPRAVGWSRPWAIYVLAKWCETNDIGLMG